MYLWRCSLLLSRGVEEGRLSARLIYFHCVWIRQNQWLCKYCRCCERPTCLPSATACGDGLILESGERLISGREKQYLLLHLLSALPACLSLFLMPFLGLRALSTKVICFPVCLGWQGLISTRGSCWVSEGEVSYLCPWLTEAEPLLPWLMCSSLWVHLFRLQDVEEEG